VRSERVYNECGHIGREREFDANGAVIRDVEVFEGGSRMSVAR